MDRTLALFFIAVLGLLILDSDSTAHETRSVMTGSGTATLRVSALDGDRTSKEMLRGQAEEKKGPGLFERIKRSVSNWVRDDDEEPDAATPTSKQSSGNTNQGPVVSVPMTPPKPVTAAEVKQSSLPASNPEKLMVEREMVESREVPRERSRQLERRMNTAETNLDKNDPVEVPNDTNDTYSRLETMRNRILNDIPADPDEEEFRDSKPVRRSSAPAPLTAVHRTSPQPVRAERDSGILEMPEDPAPRQHLKTYSVTADESKSPPSNTTVPSQRSDRSSPSYWNEMASQEPSPLQQETARGHHGRQEKSLSGPGLQPIGGIDVNIDNESLWNQPAQRELIATTSRPGTPQNQTARSATAPRNGMPQRETIARSGSETGAYAGSQTIAINATSGQPGREKAFLVSPLIEVETEGDSKVVVGQESTYRVRLRNRGGAAADQVILTVDVPNWIDILPPDVSTGTTSINPKGQDTESRDFTWKISRVDPMAEEQLILHLVPMERKTVDLRIRYDFHRSSAVARIEVQEPVIEMELQGPDEVLWGSKVGYKLVVRNTGNGDAEKVNLELLQTGSDLKSCPLPLLKAGEEQVIDVDVWTGKQDHIDINILATGAYDLSSQVTKRVKVLRPEISVEIESAQMQFVDSPADFHIVVRNEGSAPATNLELTATIPLGARYVSNDAGGKATPQNQVIWSIPSIPVGEEFVATVICEPKREGICKLDASINDGNGLVASCSGSINAEAIADLKMEIENPQGPIEVGQEAVFTIHVANRGTKAAEDVEVLAAFARGLEPFAVEGGNGTMNDGQVVFDKIPAIGAGQTITLKVKGKADRPGNHRMRTEVICPAENTHLVFEQATYFYQKYRNRNSALADKTKKSEITSAPAPLNAIRAENEPQPLKQAPPANTALLREDPFLR